MAGNTNLYINGNNISEAQIIDFSKPFDMIDNYILISKLAHLHMLRLHPLWRPMGSMHALKIRLSLGIMPQPLHVAQPQD